MTYKITDNKLDEICRIFAENEILGDELESTCNELLYFKKHPSKSFGKLDYNLKGEQRVEMLTAWYKRLLMTRMEEL